MDRDGPHRYAQRHARPGGNRAANAAPRSLRWRPLRPPRPRRFAGEDRLWHGGIRMSLQDNIAERCSASSQQGSRSPGPAQPSSPNGRPRCWQCAGRWSSCASGLAASARTCPSCPGLTSPGREPSRLPCWSFDGGFEDVREGSSGRSRPRAHQSTQACQAAQVPRDPSVV